jgi:FkbM family methyltransferase
MINLLRSLTRYYPLQQPRESLLRRLPDVPPNFGPFKAKNGIQYAGYQPGEDHVVKNLFWFGNFEPWVPKLMRCLAAPGEVVCDIGANIGDMALQVLPYLGETAQIYCFEPIPVLQDYLRQNIEINQAASITLVPKALSNSIGRMAIKSHLAQPGWSSFTGKNFSETEYEMLDIEVTTFDAWIQEMGIPQVSVCKIDVERHEDEVFAGMADSLAAKRIGGLIFEHHDGCQPSDPMVMMFAQYGYAVYRIYKGFRKIRVVPVGQTRADLRGTADYVAVLTNSPFEARLDRLK